MKKTNLENAITEVGDMYIQEAAGQEKKHRVRRKWIALSAALLLFAAMLVTVNAAAPVDLSFYLKAAFGDGYTMLDEMTAMPDNVAERSSGEEIDLELKGIMGDSQTAVVFVDLTVGADTVLPENCYSLDLDLEPTGLPWEKGLSGYGSSWGELARTVNPDGSTTFSCKMSIQSRDGVMASKYAVKCGGIRVWEEDAAAETMLLEGEWTLAFSLNYEDLTRVIPVDVTGDLLGVDPAILPEERTEEDLVRIPAQMYEVRMSPLSIGVYWKVDAEHKALMMGNDTIGFAVTLRDGTVITYKQEFIYDAEYGLIRLLEDGTWHPAEESEKSAVSISNLNTGGGADGHEEPYYGHCIMMFDAELPVDEVASVTAGGITVPVE